MTKNPQKLKLNIFTMKNKRSYVTLAIPNSINKNIYQTVTINNHYCYCLKASGKKAKYIVLCLNASTEFWKVRRASTNPDLIGNCPTCTHSDMSKPY